jgi:hypothetical protein
MARRIRESATPTIIHLHAAPSIHIHETPKPRHRDHMGRVVRGMSHYPMPGDDGGEVYESIPKYGRQDEPVGAGSTGTYRTTNGNSDDTA